MNIIAIGAHLDDIELACGGTLARAVKNGHTVKMLVLTKSAYTNHDGVVLRTEEEALSEGKAAADELGVIDLEVLDFPVKDVPYNSHTVEAIDRVLCAFKPDIIFTHWMFDTHQDHRNVSLATISAARNFSNIFFYEPFPPSGRSYMPFKPQSYVDITHTLDDKIRSLKAHTSQYKKYGEHWIEATIGRARLRGFEHGYLYAETFEVLRNNLDI